MLNKKKYFAGKILLIIAILLAYLTTGKWSSLAQDNDNSPAYKPKPYAYYEIIEKRNIFTPITLKEPVPVTVNKTEPAPRKPGLIFTGVVYNNSFKDYTAIIENGDTKEARFLKKGDKLGSLILQKIEFGKLVVSKNGTILEIALGDIIPIELTSSSISPDGKGEKEINRDSTQDIPSDLTGITERMKNRRKKQESETNK